MKGVLPNTVVTDINRSSSWMKIFKQTAPGVVSTTIIQLILTGVLIFQMHNLQMPAPEPQYECARISAKIGSSFSIKANNANQLILLPNNSTSVKNNNTHEFNQTLVSATTAEQCSFDLVTGTAKIVEKDSNAAFAHYCSNDKIQYMMGVAGFEDDCHGYANLVADLPHLSLPDIPQWGPEDDNLLQGSQQEAQKILMNELLEAHLAYLTVLKNISAMEERHICRLDHELGQDCNTDKVCNSPTSPEAMFYCDTNALISDVKFEIIQLINTDITVMGMLDIPIEVDMNAEAQPSEDITEIDMRRYTLGGVHNTLQLAASTIQTTGHLCTLEG